MQCTYSARIHRELMSEMPPAPSPTVTALTSGGRAIFWAQLAKFVIRVGSAAGLARLLTPDDYGLFGLAAVIYGLLYMARDFGIVSALQQPGEIGLRFRRLRRLGLLGGVALAAVGAAAGWFAQWVYDEPRLPAVLAAMCLGFVAGGWGAPAIGLLYRAHRMGRLAAIEVGAMTLSVVVALAGAALGLGVWALVLMGLTNDLAVAAAAWLTCGDRPDPAQRGEGAAELDLLNFSGNLTAHSLAGYCARTVDQAIVGWAAGVSPLGIYNRGAQIAALPLQLVIAPFTGWMVASLAKLRSDLPGYVTFFQRGLNGFLHLSCAAAALCVAAPDWIVLAFFGERWAASAPIVQGLAPGLAVQPLVFAQVWLLESTGQVRLQFKLSLLGMALVTAACLLASTQEIAVIARAASAGTALHGLVGLALCLPGTVIGFRGVSAALAGPVLCHGGWMSLVLLLRSGWAGDFATPGWVLLATALYYGGVLAASRRLRREVLGHFLLRP